MKKKIVVRTQGISRDLRIATGDYGSIERGTMTPEEFMNLLQSASMLRAPESPGEDLCPPHVIVEGPAGLLGFIMDGGNIYSIESGTHVSPFEASMMAAGERSPQQMDAMAQAEPQGRRPGMMAPQNPGVSPPRGQRNKRVRKPNVIRRMIAFLFAAGVFIVGVSFAINIFDEGTGTTYFGPHDNMVFGALALMVTWILTKVAYRILRGRGGVVAGAGAAGAAAGSMYAANSAYSQGYYQPGYGPYGYGHGYYGNDDDRDYDDDRGGDDHSDGGGFDFGGSDDGGGGGDD